MIWIICIIILAVFQYADNPALALRPLAPEPIHLLTSALAHKDETHLFFNLVMLLPAGLLFERKHGSLELLMFCVVTAGASGLCELWSDPTYSGAIMGASGVACGLLGSLALESGFNRAISLVLLGFFIGSIVDPADGTVAHYAHLGGYLCGLLWAILMNVKIEVHRSEPY